MTETKSGSPQKTTPQAMPLKRNSNGKKKRKKPEKRRRKNGGKQKGLGRMIPIRANCVPARKGGRMAGREKGRCLLEDARFSKNHGFLRKFYKSRLPYTEKFDQMHDIVQEELGEVDNSKILAVIFETLKDYHQASQRDPDSIYRENVQVRLLAPEPIKPLVELVPDYHNLPLEKQNEIRTQITDAYIEERRARRNMPKYEVRDVT